MNNTDTKTLSHVLASMQGKPYEQAHSLPGAFYTDPHWLDIERRYLFGQQWVCAGRIEELGSPGDYMTFDLIGEPVLLVHGSDGVIRALSNVCRHRGTKVAEGTGNLNRFVCPYHHWTYDTAGRLINAPHIETRDTFDPAHCHLPELRCTTWQGFLFVSLDANAPNLEEKLVPLTPVIKHYHIEEMRLRYLVNEVWETNWKCLLENFMEGYHLSPLHRDTLHKVNPTRLCQHLDPGEGYFGYRVGFSSRLATERIGHQDLTRNELDTCIMFAVPPGLAVGVGSDYTSFLCIRPESPSKVQVKIGLLFFGDQWRMAQIENAIGLFQQTMAEDKAVLLALQQGMGSRFHQPGPLAPRNMEGTIWDFYQYLCRHLEPVLNSHPISLHSI